MVSAVHWNGQQLLDLQSINYTICRYRWQRCTPVLSFKFRTKRKFNIVDLLFNFRQIPLSFHCIVFISNASLNLFVGNRRLNKKKSGTKNCICILYHLSEIDTLNSTLKSSSFIVTQQLTDFASNTLIISEQTSKSFYICQM